MIIIDENIDQSIVDEISSSEYTYFSIRDETPGIKDREVIEIAIREKALLLTEDKDFGRLVFSYNIKGCSVILIRYKKSDINQIIKNIRKALDQFYHEEFHYFITITSEKIRYREI